MSQSFGALLRHLRRRRGMTQTELAARLGYSRSLVSAFETDERLPNVDVVVNSFIPALELDGSRDLAVHLVNLAAGARHIRPPDDSAGRHRKRLASDEDAAQVHKRIPIAPTELIGRDREIARVCDRFLDDDVRLQTIVGPPGVGKSRLAQAVAIGLKPFFADGACYVPLAEVSSADVVAGHILAALGARHGFGGPAIARLVTLLRHKEILLLLDNFEQIVEAAPQLAHLLAECADVRFLVTSRERLHLRAEHVVHVHPLPVSAAIDLFLSRVGAVDGGMVYADADADRRTIETICRRLDGLPLAIELCAAQTDFYTLDQLLEQVKARPLDTLADDAADLPPQHRTLRGAIQASYDLLDDDERAILRVLSVFSGGGGVEAIEEVCPSELLSRASSHSDVLRALASKNLVQIEAAAGDQRRLALLQSVREFARERLEAEDDAERFRCRHFDYYLSFTRLADSHLRTPDAGAWVARLDVELDNIRAALGWTFDTGRYLENAWLVIAIQYYWRQRGLLHEGAVWTEQILPHCHNLNVDIQLGGQMTFLHNAGAAKGAL